MKSQYENLSKEQLIEELGKYKNIVEKIPSMICCFDKDLKIEFINNEYADCFSINKEEWIGKTFLDLISEKDREDVAKNIKSINYKNPIIINEHQVILKDQEIYWQKWVNKGIFNNNKDLIGYQSIGTDITVRKKAEEALAKRVEFERLISKISSDFVKLSVDDLDMGINSALASIGAFTETDRAYLFILRKDGILAENTHEWCNDGIEPQIDNLKGILLEKEMPWFNEFIKKREVFHISDVADLPPEARLEKEHFKSQGIKSIIVVPMIMNECLIGFIGFDAVRKMRTWTDSDKIVLQFVGEVFTNVLERKEAEEKLKEREKFLTLIIENIPNMIFLKSAEHLRFVRFNKAGEELLGYSREELLGKNDYDFFPKEEADFFVLKDREVLKTGVMEDIAEEIIQTKLKGKRTLHTKKIPLYDKVGNPQYLLGISEDITDRKDVEEIIREKTERFYKMFNSNPASMVVSSIPEKRILEVNDAFVKTFGYSRDEIIGKTSAELGFFVDSDRQKEVADQLQKKGSIKNIELKAKRKDGKILDGVFSGEIIDTSKGKSFLTVMIDITNRKKAEEEILKLAKFPAENPNPVLRVLKDGSIVYGNEKSGPILDFWNCNAEEKLKGEWLKVIENALEYGKSQIAEIEYNKKTYSLNFSPVKDFGYVNIYGMDITELKYLEGELIKEKRMESVGLLAGGIAHDFNNLLTVIYGNIKMMKMFYSSTDEAGKYIKAAENSINSARSLTDQLLTFSRGGEPVKEVSRIDNILKEMVEFNLHGSKVRAHFSIEENLFNVEIDVGQIKQVISNLVINASQAMPRGGNLYISASNECFEEDGKVSGLKKGDHIKFIFRDDGMGMSEETLSQIFNPFFSSKQKGRGLGLSICHSIIKKHNGFIKAKSEIDKGTTFIFYLPSTNKLLPEKIEEKRKVKLKLSLKVLVMDDEADIADVLKEFLERSGCKVEVALSGERAVEKYICAKEKGEAFDVVLLDLTLPGGIDGKETADKLKEFDKDMKAFVMSGYSKDPVLSDFEKHGFVGVMKKPFDLEEVFEMLQKI
ncbi:MAG: PAS domain S-box protein [Candidatus Aureabacteria bacterium]|nr:PAS domain S-box protein [Candidatus Auribacterota bacterium]